MTKRNRVKINYYFLLADLIFMAGIFLIIIRFLPATIRSYLPKYTLPFFIFSSVWIITGLISRKYLTLGSQKFDRKAVYITIADFISFIIFLLVLTFFRPHNLSLRLLYGLVGAMWFIEVFALMVLYIFKESAEIIVPEIGLDVPRPKFVHRKFRPFDAESQKRIEDAIIKESGNEVLEFLRQHVDLKSTGTLLISTTRSLNILHQNEDQFNAIVNLQRINDVKRINRLFETVNSKLSYGGLYASCVKTLESRKKRILKKIWVPFNYVYYSFDFLFTRMVAKGFMTRRFYYFLTEGYNRVISTAETYGRLYSCGFEVVREGYINDELYFIARKISMPVFPEDPTYGILIKLERIGKNGRKFYVYKFRTMYPFAEFIQEYVYQKNKLQAGGKFNNDYRITTIGRWLRKFWLDEIPMLANLLKGDLKIVGVRPISEQYFNLYTKELQQKRIQFKPGLIPAIYADNPGTIEEIMASEWKYLTACEKHPFLTDWKYFWKVMYVIFVRRVRSR